MSQFSSSVRPFLSVPICTYNHEPYFEQEDVASLTSLEASGLIDTLIAIKEGSIDVGIALKGDQDA